MALLPVSQRPHVSVSALPEPVRKREKLEFMAFLNTVEKVQGAKIIYKKIF